MRHRIYHHVVWTTRDRAPSIDEGAARYLEEVLPAVARQERARVLALGIVSTHVHLLIRVHPTTLIPRVIQRMKGGTAVGAIRGSSEFPIRIRWAKGYNIQSVSERALQVVGLYIQTQPQHHPEEAIVG